MYIYGTFTFKVKATNSFIWQSLEYYMLIKSFIKQKELIILQRLEYN